MQCSMERKSLLRTKVVTTKRRLLPKIEVVTQNFNRRERQRGCDMRLRSRPLINEAVRNLVATKENLVATEMEQIKRTHVATSTQGRDLRQ